MNPPAASPGRAGLLLLLTGQMLPLIDTSITNVALASITRSLNAGATQLELIIALYGVAFAVCLAVGGRLGDNYGRRRLFICGTALFGAASLCCGLAQSVTFLLLARTLQGAGAALLAPQILATLHVTLRGEAHTRAIGLYGGIAGIAFIVGQMGGGWLVSADIAGLGWRNAFFINVPVCLLVLAFSRRYLPETRRPQRAPVDAQGALWLALILCCLLFPLALGPELRWPWFMLLTLAAVPPLLAGMRAAALRQQRRGAQPLLPPHLLRDGGIRFAMAIALLFFSGWSGFMFCMALTMQAGLGMTPAQAGDSFIALGVSYFVSALALPKMHARYGAGRLLSIGLMTQICGLALLAATFWLGGETNTALTLAPASLPIGYGQALIVNSFYRIGMRDIRPCDAGAASALLSTLQQATLGLGPALLGSLFLTFAQHNGGRYPPAMIGFLAIEALMMLTLSGIALRLRADPHPAR